MKYKYLRYERFCTSGLVLRQLWTWICVLLVAAFSSTIKSFLIKQPEPNYISRILEIPSGGIPVILPVYSAEFVDTLKYSPYSVDNWLHENVRDVIVYGNQ